MLSKLELKVWRCCVNMYARLDRVIAVFELRYYRRLQRVGSPEQIKEFGDLLDQIRR